MQKMLSDYELEDKIENKTNVVDKPKSILEQINEMRVKKEGKDWGYKDNPKTNKTKGV